MKGIKKKLSKILLSLTMVFAMAVSIMPTNVLATTYSESNSTITNDEKLEAIDKLSSALSHDISTGSLILNHSDGCSESTPHVVMGSTTQYGIIHKENEHWVTLDNVTIDLAYENDGEFTATIPINNEKGSLHLELKENSTNILKKATNLPGPGILVGDTLTISGNGTLIVPTGICNPDNTLNTNITINGGNIILDSYLGSMMGTSNVTINGGNVNISGLFGILAGITQYAKGNVTINGGIVNISSTYQGIYCSESGLKISGSAQVNIFSSEATSFVYPTISAPDGSNVANIVQLNLALSTPKDTRIEIKDTAGNSLSPAVYITPDRDFKSIALSLPSTGEYTMYQGDDKLTYISEGVKKDTFKIGPGLNTFTDVVGPDVTIAKNVTINTSAPLNAERLANGSASTVVGMNTPTITWSDDDGTTYKKLSGQIYAKSNVAYKTKYVFTAKTGYAFDNTVLASDINVTNLGAGTKTVSLSDDKKTMTVIVTWEKTSLSAYTGTEASPISNTAVEKTDSKIEVVPIVISDETVEYAISTSNEAPTNDSDWQDSTIFTGLTENTEYYFFARVKANTSHKVGAVSTGTMIKTDKSNLQKINEAKPLAQAAITEITATNSTAVGNILDAVTTAISPVDGVTASWKTEPTVTLAAKDNAGSITGTIVLSCGSETVEVEVNKTIAQLPITDKDKVDEANPLAQSAITAIIATNDTTSGNILEAVTASVVSVDGITASWKSAPTITPATKENAGSITGIIVLTCGSETVEVTVNKVIEKLPTPTPDRPTITVGNSGSNHQINNGKDMTFTCSGKLEDLTGVYVDGKLIDESNYTLLSGSTILTLKASYLDTLSDGKHTLKFQYKDNVSAETDFTIIAKSVVTPPKPSSPQTGDTSNTMLYLGLIVLSGCVAGFGLKKKKSLIK